MRTARIAFGILLLLLGAVWAGQGLGFIRGSFMTGSPTWLAIGILVDLAALAMLFGPAALGRLRRR